jgi:FkbM family methyltransferase
VPIGSVVMHFDILPGPTVDLLGQGMGVDRVVVQLQLRTRRMASRAVRRLPVTVADRLRGPVTASPQSRRHRAHDALLQVLRRGGIPAGVTTFTLRDNPQLLFVNAESLVLHQLCWFGEQGWEPQLLPWWRSFCRRSSAILELGDNVGYFTVQGAKAGPQARYVAVEPYPASARVCRANPELNRVESVELVTAAAVAHTAPPAVELHVPGDQLTTPTVAFIGAHSELPQRMRRHVTQTVSVTAVDVRSLLPGIDLLKLDVEGQEHALLAASREYLRTRKPTVFVEVLPGPPGFGACLRTCATTTASTATYPVLMPWSGSRSPTYSAVHCSIGTVART